MKLFNAVRNELWIGIFESEAHRISEDIIIKPLKVEELDDYVRKEEMWSVSTDPTTPPCKMVSAYSKVDGSYIGTESDTKRMIEKFGLSKIQLARPENKVASIGFIESQQKWAGWSHRAIASFGIGDEVFEDVVAYSGMELPKEPIKKKKKKVIDSLDRAKESAINFARSVS